MNHPDHAIRRLCGDGPACFDPMHLTFITAWDFGTVIRVDPANERVPQPDDRRWLILSPANTSAGRPWLTMFLGPGGAGTLVPFAAMTGFVHVEEDES